MTDRKLGNEIQRHRRRRAAEFDPHVPRFEHDLVGWRAVGPDGDDVVEDLREEPREGDAG